MPFWFYQNPSAILQMTCAVSADNGLARKRTPDAMKERAPQGLIYIRRDNIRARRTLKPARIAD